MLAKLGLRHPFFLPPLRRGLTVGAIALWAALEAWNGHTGWAIFALLVGLICALEFFILFDPKNYQTKHHGGGDD